MKDLRKIKYLLMLCVLISTAKEKTKDKDVSVDKVVAIVGKNVVLKSDIEKAIIQLEAEGENVSDIKNIACHVFEQLLFECLLENQAGVDSVKITKEEIDANVEQRLQTIISQIGSVEKMMEFYGQTETEIRNQAYEVLSRQLLAQKVQQKIIKDIDITPEEVRIFFNKIPETEIPEVEEEFELAQIVIKPELSEDSKKVVVEKLTKIRDEILEGVSFRAKAALYSEDPGSASKGGEYKGIKRGVFVKEFEAVAFNLEEGEISQPVETDFGYHIIQLIKRRGDELDLRHILLRPTFNDEELKKAEKTLDSIRTLIVTDSINFEMAVKLFSEDKFTKFNDGRLANYAKGTSKLTLGDLDPNTFEIVKDLEIGELTKVVLGQNHLGQQEFKIYKLINKIQPHKLNFRDDYDKIKQLALQEKREKVTQEWRKEKIKSTYINIKEDMGCDFVSEWKNKQ